MRMVPRSVWGRLRSWVAVLTALAWLAGCAGPSDDQATTVADPVVPTEDPAAPGAIWPGTGQARLEQLRGLANRGQRPDLLDPVETARSYLATGLPSEARAAGAASGLVFARFAPTGASTGEVSVHGRRLAPTTVSLRRYDGPAGQSSGQRAIWYVQGVGSADLAVLDVDYDGSRLTGALVPGRAGQVVMRTAALDGTVLEERPGSAATRRLIQIGTVAKGQPAIVFSAVLTGDDGVSSVRVFRIGAPTP
jgi:hypothetical protein